MFGFSLRRNEGGKGAEVKIVPREKVAASRRKRPKKMQLFLGRKWEGKRGQVGASCGYSFGVGSLRLGSCSGGVQTLTGGGV